MSGIDDRIVTVGTAFRRMAGVSAVDDFRISVAWTDGTQNIVDLAPSVMTFKVYAPLRDDRRLFDSVHLVNASVLAWGDDGAIDMHVSEVERLSGEAMQPADFQSFLHKMDFTWDAAAAQLGISRRMVGYYAGGRAVPRYIALACAQLEARRRISVRM